MIILDFFLFHFSACHLKQPLFKTNIDLQPKRYLKNYNKYTFTINTYLLYTQQLKILIEKTTIFDPLYILHYSSE